MVARRGGERFPPVSWGGLGLGNFSFSFFPHPPEEERAGGKGVVVGYPRFPPKKTGGNFFDALRQPIFSCSGLDGKQTR